VGPSRESKCLKGTVRAGEDERVLQRTEWRRSDLLQWRAGKSVTIELTTFKPAESLRSGELPREHARRGVVERSTLAITAVWVPKNRETRKAARGGR